MDSRLFKILLELEYKYDIEIKDYFKLTEEDRDYIATVVSNGLIQHGSALPITIHSYLAVINRIIRESEYREEYEKCELFSRIEKKLFDSIENMV